MKNLKVRISAPALLLLALIYCAAPDVARAQESHYHLTKTIKLNGDTSWDYLSADSAARRLYVAHYNHVTVLDIDTGKLVGQITGLEGVHGVAVAPASGHGFASNGKTNSITIFNLKTLAVTGHATAGGNPDAIILDPFSQRVFAFNHNGGDVTVLHAADGSPAGTVMVGGMLEYAVADGKGSVFVNIEDSSEIVRINSQLKVDGRWPMASCKEPTGLAMDPHSRRLFSACHNAMLAVVDADDGHLVASVPIGHGCDGVRFDPATATIFTSNGEGSLSIIHEDSADKYRVVDNVPTQRGARTLALDLSTHRVFTATAQFGPMPPQKAGEWHRPPILPGTFVVLEYSP